MNNLGNKKIFSKNLQKYMKINNKDRIEVCNDLCIPYTTFNDWYNGKVYPRIDKIEQLSLYFGIEKSDLIENNNIFKDKIPVLGIVRAGYNYLAEENVIGYVSVNDNTIKNEDFFALEVKGNSMEPIIYEKDIAIVKKQESFDNGDIVVALINGDEATIKRAYKNEKGIVLQPANPMIEPLVFEKEDIINLPVQIIGIVYNITRKFK